MTIQERIKAFSELGRFLWFFSKNKGEVSGLSPEEAGLYEKFWGAIETARHHNGWFTKENILFSIEQWENSLTEENLRHWLSRYDFPNSKNPKTVGIVMPGNIPLVGFHDFLSVLMSGNKALVRLSSNDKLLLPVLAEILVSKNPGFRNLIEFTKENLKNFDAVIATGSNNTARYFEYYFSKKPNIIRKNRASIAVLDGSESLRELELLGNDIFRYFGLGCRNVSKLYVPEDYDFDDFFKSIYAWKDLINHSKYANNYDYNKAVYLMSDYKILDNGFMLLKEYESLGSPISVVFFEKYSDREKLKEKLKSNYSELQCIVSNGLVENSLAFGQTQQPALLDYADGVDTLDFLMKS